MITSLQETFLILLLYYANIKTGIKIQIPFIGSVLTQMTSCGLLARKVTAAATNTLITVGYSVQV